MKIHVIESLVAQLNCLSRVAALEDAPRSQQLAKSLADVLRYRNTRQGQIVQGRSELETANAFLEIFALRFEERFTGSISGAALMTGILIPHYTLMTFVENAVYHAFGGSDGAWQLSIDAQAHGSLLEITVSDNGIGFDVRQSLVAPDKTAEYGTIASTAWRLAEHRGQPVLSIDSAPARGTRVRIQLARET